MLCFTDSHTTRVSFMVIVHGHEPRTQLREEHCWDSTGVSLEVTLIGNHLINEEILTHFGASFPQLSGELTPCFSEQWVIKASSL